jgi:hypothetical protein
MYKPSKFEIKSCLDGLLELEMVCWSCSKPTTLERGAKATIKPNPNCHQIPINSTSIYKSAWTKGVPRLVLSTGTKGVPRVILKEKYSK